MQKPAKILGILVFVLFLLFFASLGLAYYIFNQQSEELANLRTKIKSLAEEQTINTVKLSRTGKKLEKVMKNMDSLEDTQSSFFNRLEGITLKLTTQEKERERFISRLSNLSSRLGSLEKELSSFKEVFNSKVSSLLTPQQPSVNLGNISVEKEGSSF